MSSTSAGILQGAHGFVMNNPMLNERATFILNEPPPRERPGEAWGNVVCDYDQTV